MENNENSDSLLIKDSLKDGKDSVFIVSKINGEEVVFKFGRGTFEKNGSKIPYIKFEYVIGGVRHDFFLRENNSSNEKAPIMRGTLRIAGEEVKEDRDMDHYDLGLWKPKSGKDYLSGFIKPESDESFQHRTGRDNAASSQSAPDTQSSNNAPTVDAGDDLPF